MMVHELQPGDILIQRDESVWSRFTFWWAAQPYPHAIMVDSQKGLQGCLCVESGATGVRYVLLNHGLITGYEVWRPKTSAKLKAVATQWVANNAAAQYDYWNLLVLGTLTKLNAPRPEWLKKKADGKANVCSELIARAYLAAGYDVAPHVEDEDTKPWDLRNDRSERLL